MRKLWKRFKNWLIQKLGGYCKAEYKEMEAALNRQLARNRELVSDLHAADIEIQEMRENMGRHYVKQIEIRKEYVNIETLSTVRVFTYDMLTYIRHSDRAVSEMKMDMAREIGLQMLDLGALEFKEHISCGHPLTNGDEAEIVCTAKIAKLGK